MTQAESTARTTAVEPFRPFVLIPTYNNAGTIQGVVDSVLVRCKDVLVVNDGSTDETAGLLANLGVDVVTHPVNRGKGAALLTGFRRGEARGFTHALTFDADGQHHAEDIPRLLDEAENHPLDVILGARDMIRDGAPAANELAGRMSDFGIKVQTGLGIRDSQSGFRVYPLAVVNRLPLKARRFEFEIDVLIRACWAGARVRNMPIGVTYFPEEERITHFRPWRDTLRTLALHGPFLLRRLLPIPHRRLVPPDAAAASSDESLDRKELLKRARQWGIRGAWNHLVRDRATPVEIAAAVGIGVVVGTSPLYGLHTVIVLFLAIRWHLNPVAAFLGSNISILPLVPLIGSLCILVGSLVIHQAPPDVSFEAFHPSLSGLGHLLWRWFWPWLIGWPFVAATLGVIIGLITYHAVRLVRFRRGVRT
jgi:uncharacterized protein (DUF2062 family)